MNNLLEHETDKNSEVELSKRVSLKSISETWFNSFWKMIKYNVVWILFNLPLIILFLLGSNWLITLIVPSLSYSELNKLIISFGLPTEVNRELTIFFGMNVTLLLTVFIVGNLLFVLSPIQCAFTSIFNKHINKEHVFFGYEIKKTIKNNLKQALAHQLIQFIVLLLFPVAIYVYRILLIPLMLKTVLTALVSAMFILFCMMQFYVYQMMITFELSLKNIYKNAFILVLAKLPQNIGSFLLGNLCSLGIPLLSLLFIPQYSFQISIIYILGFSFSISQLVLNKNAKNYVDMYLRKNDTE